MERAIELLEPLVSAGVADVEPSASDVPVDPEQHEVGIARLGPLLEESYRVDTASIRSASSVTCCPTIGALRRDTGDAKLAAIQATLL